MRNLSSYDALGGTIGASNQTISLGPRYRRWLTPSTALDLGLAAAWTPGRIEIAEVHVAIMYRDQVGLWARAAHDFGAGHAGLTMGVKVGSHPGLITYVLEAIATAIYVVRVAQAAS